MQPVMIRARISQRVLRKVQQPLHLVIQLQKTRPLKQPRQTVTLSVVATCTRQVHDQHVILATPGKRMSLATRHDTGVQTIDRAALPLHFKIRAAAQADHQLVFGVRVNRSLNGQIQYSGSHQA